MSRRHLARSIVLQALYEWDFYSQKADLVKIIERDLKEYGPGLEDEAEFIWRLAHGVVGHKKEIDALIEKAAPDWPLANIAIVDRNVLRIGFFELLYLSAEEVPPPVAINEAIEIAKNYGGPNSGKFINGVLGTVYAQMEKMRKEGTMKENERMPKLADKDKEKREKTGKSGVKMKK